MTREQESDSTLSPEKEEGGVETPSHKDWKEGEGTSLCYTGGMHPHQGWPKER